MKKRSKFWTFIFSLFPGAGHMFMGFMKRGVSLMSLFFAVLLVSSWLNMGPLLFILPVLWFYSFFDCINIRWSSDEDFARLRDDYLLSPERLSHTGRGLRRYALVVGVVLIFLGIYALLSSLLETITAYGGYGIYEEAIVRLLHHVLRVLPRLMGAFLILFIGVRLILGKKKELKEDVEG